MRARIFRQRPELESVGCAWHALRAPRWSTAHANDIRESLEREVFPVIGAKPIADIEEAEVLELLQGTAQLPVRAQVVSHCEITTKDLDFGFYNSACGAMESASVAVSCTAGSAAVPSLDGGGSGNPRARRMTGPAELNYQLYRDAEHLDPLIMLSAAWQISARVSAGTTVTYTIYGQIPAGQIVPLGNYSDTVRLTVEY